jgi:uncharacterized membrane protein
MKWLSLGVFLLFMLVLVFFTFFGNAIYDRITPEVSSVTDSGSLSIDGVSYIRVLKDVLGEDGVVFEIISVTGFSRELSYLRTLKIEYAENLFDWEDGVVYVTGGLRPGARLLLSPDESHNDGDRVRVRRGR